MNFFLKIIKCYNKLIPYTTNTTASIKIVFNSLNNFHINFPTLNLKLPQLKFYQSDRVQIDTDGFFVKNNQGQPNFRSEKNHM